MGILGTIAGFVGGYAAGVKFGDRPIQAARNRMDEARGRATSMVSTAGSKVMEGAVDLRQVREVMTTPPETVRPEAKLRQAATVMQERGIGDVLVVNESGELRGIVTDRDLAIRAVAEERDPSSTTVGEVMSPIAVTVSPTDTVEEALVLMRRHDVRRLPVLENERPVGIVSLGDLSRTRRAGAALADISAAPPNN